MKADQLKQMNVQKIKDYFYCEKKASKNRLSEDTEISKTTCTVLLKERYGVEIVGENDVYLAAVGYHTEENSLVFLYQPKARYSGCGIMLNHQLHRGNATFAGEVGHLRGGAFLQPYVFEGLMEAAVNAGRNHLKMEEVKRI